MSNTANSSVRTIEDSLRDLEGFISAKRTDKDPLMDSIPRDTKLFENLNINELNTCLSRNIDCMKVDWYSGFPSVYQSNKLLSDLEYRTTTNNNNSTYYFENKNNNYGTTNIQFENTQPLLQEIDLNVANSNSLNGISNYVTTSSYYNYQIPKIDNNIHHSDNKSTVFGTDDTITNISQDLSCYNENFNHSMDFKEENCSRYAINNKKPIKSNAIIPTWIQIPNNSKFFIIKCNSIENIKKSFYNGIWSSTKFGNKRLSNCFKTLQKWEKIFLFFSVNGSGKFCGVAEMISDINENLDTTIWENNNNCKFNHAFKCRWIIVRDIKNKYLKKFFLPNNEMKPITSSRDTQEIPFTIGCSLIKIFKSQNVDIEKRSFLDVDY